MVLIAGGFTLATQGSRGTAVPVDFRRSDRLTPAQIRATCLLHENFARNVGPSLSAYLRASVVVSVTGVEQLCGADFTTGLPVPCCLAVLRVQPVDCQAVLEVSSTVVFPMLELLLGGTGKSSTSTNRKMTAIERRLIDGILEIIAVDLKDAWKGGEQALEVALHSVETDAQSLRAIAPADALVMITMDMRVGESSGTLKLALPFQIVKTLGQQSDSQKNGPGAEITQMQRERTFRSIQAAKVDLEARLDGPTVPFSDLLGLRPGTLVNLGHPVSRPVDCLVNQTVRFKGHVVGNAGKRAFLIDERS